MKIKRREFLATAVAGTAGLWVGGRTAAAAPPSAAPAGSDPTALVPLGKVLKVCRIGAGTGMNGGNRQSNQVRLGREKFENLLAYVYDQNVRLFDLADLYGTHPFAARVLKGKPRDSYALATKIWWRPGGGVPEKQRPDADLVVARFLRELQTDYLDLVQLHCVSEPDWPQNLRKQMDILAKLKEKGLIRAHGVSVHGLEALEAVAGEPWVDVLHVRINPTGKTMDAPPEKVVPVLKKVHAAGKGIIGMKIAGEGSYDAAQKKESLRWVMGLGCVDVFLGGFEKPEQVDEFKANVRRQLVAMSRRRAAAVA